jgi:hypothetical protein
MKRCIGSRSMSRKTIDNYYEKHRRHHKKGKHASSTSSASSSSDGDDGLAAGNWSSRSGSSSSSSSHSSDSASYDESARDTGTSSKKMASRDPAAEAQVTYKTGEYHFEFNTTPADRYDSKGNLKHNGDIIISLKNGRLDAGHLRHHQDFAKEHVRTREITKAIRLRDLTVTGWDGAITFAFPTVPAYKNEKFGEEGFVSKRVGPNVLGGQPQTIEVMSRKITNASIDFQRQYKDLDPHKFDKHVQFTEHFATWPMNSPVTEHFNADPVNAKRQLTRPAKGMEKLGPDGKGLVMGSVEEGRKYGEMAKKQMENKISYGDMTHEFEMRISVPTPSDRVRQHKAFEKGEKDGLQFKRFADPAYALPGADLSAKEKNGRTVEENFMHRHQRFAGVIEFEYFSEVDKPVVASTKSRGKK